MGPSSAESSSQFHNKETYYELCDRRVLKCEWVTVVNYTMATCLLKRYRSTRDAGADSEFYCHGNAYHFGDTAEGLQLLSAHWACIMTYFNLMRLWPARNVLASVNMAIKMRTFVPNATVTEAEKAVLNERFLNIQKMKVAGDNLFKKFAFACDAHSRGKLGELHKHAGSDARLFATTARVDCEATNPIASGKRKLRSDACRHLSSCS